VKPLYGNDKSVRPSVSPSVCLSEAKISLQRDNIFERGFRHPTQEVLTQFKFVFKGNRKVPSRSTVKGHTNFKYIAPSCEVSLERSCKGLSNDIYMMGPVTVVWPAETLLRSVNYPIHDVRCRWKGLVKSFLTMHKICTLRLQNVYKMFIKRLQNVHQAFTKRLQNVHQRFTKRSSNVHQAFAKRSSNVYKTFIERLQNVHRTFTKRSSNIYKTFIKRLQNVHKTFIKRSQSTRFQNVLNQNIHKTFTTHSLSHCGFAPWLYPFWTVYYSNLIYAWKARVRVHLIKLLLSTEQPWPHKTHADG
jgi:hypothetical protein